jgi:uncharacterized protein DUF551
MWRLPARRASFMGQAVQGMQSEDQMVPTLKWTKVEDRMPAEGDRVLVFLDSGHIHDAYRNVRFAGGFCTDADGGHAIQGVKEWMPYPK